MEGIVFRELRNSIEIFFFVGLIVFVNRLLLMEIIFSFFFDALLVGIFFLLEEVIYICIFVQCKI